MKPKQLDDAFIVFPSNVYDLMPPIEEIDKIRRDYKNNEHRRLESVVQHWFFEGINRDALTPKKGIDAKTALRHIKAIMGSFQPKHEHKIAAVAMLLGEWFDVDDVKAKAKPEQK